MPNPIWRYLFIAAVIGAIITVIVLIVKKIKGKPASNSESEPETPSAPPTPSPAAFSHPTASAPTAKIFINGGRPAGAMMGRLYVDGKLFALPYSEAPIEVTIPAGYRHIVIEGGVYGDARIDRTVHFDSLDVLTVDMPGEADADVIRHQMISYSEYRGAIRDCGYTVTRKFM